MSSLEQPRRMTLSAIVELLLTRHDRERSSVSLTRAPNGETVIDVKVRTGDDPDTLTVEDAERKAVAVYDRLAKLYAPPAEHDTASVSLTRNAKGETQISVDLKTGENERTVGEAGAAAQREYDRLRARYPMADGMTARPGSVS